MSKNYLVCLVLNCQNIGAAAASLSKVKITIENIPPTFISKQIYILLKASGQNRDLAWEWFVSLENTWVASYYSIQYSSFVMINNMRNVRLLASWNNKRQQVCCVSVKPSTCLYTNTNTFHTAPF